MTVDHTLNCKLAAEALARIHRDMATLEQIAFQDILDAGLKNEETGEAVDPLMVVARLEDRMMGLRRELRAEKWMRTQGKRA